MKFVYELNLPSLDQIILPEVAYLIRENSPYATARYSTHLASDVIKSEWLTINNYLFDQVLLFYKPSGYTGRIHTDIGDFSNQSTTHPWGINWIFGGSGVMKFWTPENIGEPKFRIDECGLHTYNYTADKEPDEIVYMKPGAYLVNGEIPHEPSSQGKRFCLSLRSTANYNLTWDQTVNNFSKYIKTQT